MKIIILLLSLGLFASCGADTRYADTLTSGDEHQPKEGGHTGKIVGGVIVGAVVTACVVSGLKKRCIPFVKRITRTDDLSKEVRQAIKDGEITKKEAKAIMRGGDQIILPNDEALTLFNKRVESLTDREKVTELISQGRAEGKYPNEIDELTRYQKEINQKAIQQLVDEGKITPKDAKELKGVIPGSN